MRGLIADLLDQGRIETGTLSVSPEPAELAGLVDQARSTLLSSGSGHVLDIDLPENLPRVMADPGRIVQVLNNLLSNAARHSPRSSPIRDRAAARDGLHVAISVSDRGPGRAAGPAAAPVPQARRRGRRRGGSAGSAAPAWGCRYARDWWRRTAAASGRRAPGRGQGTRFTFTLPAADRAAAAADAVPRRSSPAPQGGRADAHPRGRRRPGDPALRAGRPRRGGLLRPGRDRRPPKSCPRSSARTSPGWSCWT